MKRPLCLTVLFILAWIQAYAQDHHVVDSLQGVLQSNLDDTFKVQALIGLAGETYTDSPMVAIQYCDQARALSERAKYDQGSTEAFGWLAYLYEQQGLIQKALAYYHKSLIGAEKSGDKKEVGTILNNIAAIYKDQGKIENALAMNKASLMIKNEIGDLEGVSATLNNMGLIYGSQGKVQEALALYWQSVKIEEKLKNYEGVAISLLNIAFIYKEQKEYEDALTIARKVLDLEQRTGDKYQSGSTLNFLGTLMDEQGKGDSALHYYQTALKVRAEIGDTLGMAYTSKNLGTYYEKVGNLDQAKEAFQSSLASFRQGDNKLGETQATTRLGGLFLKTNDLASAELYLVRSMQLANELGFPAEQRNAAAQLQELYRQKGDWKQALEMNELFVQMRDSVANLENKKAAIKAQYRYEYEQKEARLKEEQQHKDALAEAEIAKQKLIRNSFFAGFAVVLLFAAIFLLQRNRISKEKKRSEELLLNILPAKVAEELKAKGSADAQLIDQVTVLFTDFRGFTQLAEELGPKDLVAELHLCFSAFDEIIQRHGVEKIKTIGDAYMAAGGLPTPNATHGKDVVRAALEIQAFMLRQSQKNQAEGKPCWEIRIGIHTGPVTAGIVGLKKFQYDIWGDTVNTASRMESSGEVGKVNLSGSTYALVKDSFKCTYRGKIAAKGKGEIDMYFLEG